MLDPDSFHTLLLQNMTCINVFICIKHLELSHIVRTTGTDAQFWI